MQENDEIFFEVKSFVRDNLKVTLSLDGTGKSPRTRRKLQHIASIKYPSKSGQALFESILRHAFQAERECPGAGLVFLENFTSEDKSSIVEEVRLRSRSDIYDVLTSLDMSRIAYDLLVTALEYSTSSTKISLKKSSNGQTYIDVIDGYSFTARSLLRSPSLDLKDVKVACIDGYVETVSEIHHLLTHLSEVKRPCLLFVRGMSDEVLHTLKVNNDRKTVLTYPYVIPFDPENVNTIVDIAVVSGTDVVSSTKGNLISSIDVNHLGFLETCTLSGDVLRFKNSKTRNRVKEHMTSIRKMIEERPDIDKILSARAKSLSSSCIDICLPDDTNIYSLSQQLDEGIRVITSVLSNSYHPKEIAKKVFESFQVTFSQHQVTLFTS